MSKVRTSKARRSAAVPPTADVLRLLDEAISRLNPMVEATVWVAEERAAELRAMAGAQTPAHRFGRAGSDLEISAPLGELSSIVASQGADAVALRPADLRVRVVSILTAAQEATR